MLAAIQISRTFTGDGGRDLALAPVSLQVDPGDFLVISGPSGSGKTTLLNLLSGLDRPTTGRILFAGQNLAEMAPAERAALRNASFGFIFQTPHLLFDRTVAENVTLPFHYGRVAARSAIARKVADLLSYVGLEDLAGRRVATLSGGEMQRVVFARALVRSPQVIFADEPTGSLDSDNSRRILALLQEQAAGGRLVILVSHDPQVAVYGTVRVNLAKVSRGRSRF